MKKVWLIIMMGGLSVTTTRIHSAQPFLMAMEQCAESPHILTQMAGGALLGVVITKIGNMVYYGYNWRESMHLYRGVSVSSALGVLAGRGVALLGCYSRARAT